MKGHDAAGRRIMVDCRWLGSGGAGTVTDLFLRGCAEIEPEGEWILWGPESVQSRAWPGARHSPSRHSPRTLAGQRSSLGVPNADIRLFLHQLRPVFAHAAVTMIYDTIPTRYGRHRRAKATFLKGIAQSSRGVITISEASRLRLIEDLGVEPEKIDLVHLPLDPELVERVERARAQAIVEPFLLYVGRFAPHKNLPRLMRAFSASGFRASGGRLLLVGGSPAEIAELRSETGTPPGVDVRTGCSQQELEDLYARCVAVVMPSLEEGFGLPAWEALTCGVPLAISDAPALREATRNLIHPFPATSEQAMSEAIDRAVAESGTEIPIQRAREARHKAPDIASFARSICEIIARR